MRGPYIHPLAIELNAFSAICYASIRIKFSFVRLFIIFLGVGCVFVFVFAGFSRIMFHSCYGVKPNIIF